MTEYDIEQGIFDLLNHHNLTTLSLAYRRGSFRKRLKLRDDILQQTGVDISNIELLRELSSEDLAKLSTYEAEHYKALANQLISELNTRDAFESRTVQKSTNSKSMMLVYWFGIALAAVSVLYMVMITWIPIPKDNMRFADTSLGFILGSMLSTIIQYFFGTSMRKTDFHSISDVKRTTGEVGKDENKK